MDSMKKAIKHWWLSLVVGIVSIIVGVLCFASPDKSLVGLTYVFIASFLIGGVLEIAFALSNRDYRYGWGWTLAAGILEIILGILLIALPMPTVTVILIFMVGFWILFRSIWGIAQSCQLGALGIRGWVWLLALSILSLVFSFLYMLSPAFGGMFLVIFVGSAMILYGLFRMVMAFEVRQLGKDIGELK